MRNGNGTEAEGQAARSHGIPAGAAPAQLRRRWKNASQRLHAHCRLSGCTGRSDTAPADEPGMRGARGASGEAQGTERKAQRQEGGL